MRYNMINSCECTNGLGWGVSLFVQGCPIHCKGCFNPETWDFQNGKEWKDSYEQKILGLINKPYISRFSILGGEPLVSDNLWELFSLCYTIKKFDPSIEIWLWTGYTKEQLQERLKKVNAIWPALSKDHYLRPLLEQVDILVAGPFVQEEKDLTLKWRGSRNQEIININEAKKW